MYTRSKEEVEESQYIVDLARRELEQQFADGRVVVTPMPSRGGKSIPPLTDAIFRRNRNDFK